eukprot:2004440-Rhodomonas_salina.3
MFQECGTHQAKLEVVVSVEGSEDAVEWGDGAVLGDGQDLELEHHSAENLSEKEEERRGRG